MEMRSKMRSGVRHKMIAQQLNPAFSDGSHDIIRVDDFTVS
jgi:hypothetical protein